jgi:uncharacterized protein YdhG (YjbR/CyaY superfamily)
MRSAPIRPRTIDDYIAGFSDEVRVRLGKIRQTIRRAAPDAQEVLSYGIPTFRLGGNLVHCAAFKNHIGFYPTPSGIENFRNELAPYAISKGSIRFPPDQPIPYGLIGRIVKFRVKENLAKAEPKRKKPMPAECAPDQASAGGHTGFGAARPPASRKRPDHGARSSVSQKRR